MIFPVEGSSSEGADKNDEKAHCSCSTGGVSIEEAFVKGGNNIIFSEGIKSAGFEILSDQFFDTVTIKTKDKTKEIYEKALAKKINLTLDLCYGII